jgi:hypothetical protein
MQESFNFCYPFPNFLIHVIVFCNDVCTPFKQNFINLKHAFTSSIAYYTTFNISWPKQEPTNQHGNWSGEQDTTYVKVEVKINRFDPLSFTWNNLIKQAKWGQQFNLSCHGYIDNLVHFQIRVITWWAPTHHWWN